MTEIYLAHFPLDVDIEQYIHIIKKFVNIDINYKSKQTIIGWWILVKLLLGKIGEKDISFNTSKYGKPYLLGNKLYFNISHSKQKVAVALSNGEVGIDIEKISNPNLKIVDRFFTYDEKNFIFSCKDKLKIAERFYVVWTLKESYLKYKGIGLKQSLKSFGFNILSTGEATLCLVEDCIFNNKRIDGYIISCCSKKTAKNNNVEIKKWCYL